MSSRRTYPPEHPASIALVALAMASLCKVPLFEALTERARRYGIEPDSEQYDQAAAAAGMPYCRALDLYVDPATKARAEALHFTEAHLALL